MDESAYWQVQKEYRKHLANRQDASEFAVRVSLQSTSTIDPLAAYLWMLARKEGLAIDVQIGPFGQHAQEILDPGSTLYGFNPEVVFLILSPTHPELAVRQAESLQPLIETFQRHSTAALVVTNCIVPSFPFRLQHQNCATQVAAGNRTLEEIVGAVANVQLLDLDTLAGHFGKVGLIDPKLHYMGGIDFSPGFLELLARKCLTFVRLARRSPRKVLVLDLDDTLWGGVVGEVGERGIALSENGPGSEYVAFQHAILRLANQGVVLAIASKNNPADALAVLEGHPCMLLRKNRFAAIRLNWNDKATSLREIAAEFNLGLDSFVFLDNSPVERGWVRQSLPDVLTPELPEDPALYAPFLDELDVFETPVLTDEDRQRGRLYAEEADRKGLLESAASLDEYLRDLNIKLRIFRLDAKHVVRAAQMLQKTNQFNLTTRRHTEGTVLAFLTDPAWEIFALKVSDAYGDSGMTGLAILEYRGKSCRLDSFLLSCRVLGRRIEESFLRVVASSARNRACTLTGEYIPSRKNEQVRDFYSRMGFTAVEAVGMVQRFALDLSHQEMPECALHEVQTEGFEQ